MPQLAPRLRGTDVLRALRVYAEYAAEPAAEERHPRSEALGALVAPSPVDSRQTSATGGGTRRIECTMSIRSSTGFAPAFKRTGWRQQVERLQHTADPHPRCPLLQSEEEVFVSSFNLIAVEPFFKVNL